MSDKPEISFDEFMKMDIRVATVVSCEPVKKSNKLLKFELDIGEEGPRTVISGLKKHYAPDQLLGEQVVYLANLAPRKMFGVESRGMILAAGDDTSLFVIKPDVDESKDGTAIKVATGSAVS